jgi:hypothetical protein
LLEAFHTDEICPDQFSKVVDIMLPAFQKRIVHQKPIMWISKSTRLDLAGFQKLSVQLKEICNPRGAKNLDWPAFKSIVKIKKAFCTKRVIDNYIKKLLKGQYEKILISCQTLSRPKPNKLSHFSPVIISFPCSFKSHGIPTHRKMLEL